MKLARPSLTLIGLVLVLAIMAWMVAGCGGGSTKSSIPTVNPTASGGSSAILASLISKEQQGAVQVGNDTCLTAGCHDGVNKGRAAQHTRAFSQTLHAQKGVKCEDCHGAGSKHAAAEKATDPNGKKMILGPGPHTGPDGTTLNLGVLDSAVCAQCHSSTTGSGLSQYDQWTASKHFEVVEGAQNPGSPAYNKSGCANCHNGIVRALETDAGNPIDSTHPPLVFDPSTTANIALVSNTVTCVSCHDPMDVTAQAHQVMQPLSNTAYDYLTVGAANANVGPQAPVTAYTTLNQICGKCHNGRGVDPSDARLAGTSVLSRPNMHDGPQYNMLMGYGGNEVDANGNAASPPKRYTAHRDVEGQCAHCHMGTGGNHTMKAETQNCLPCHSATDAATSRAFGGRMLTQNDIGNLMLTVQSKLNAWGASKNIDSKGILSWEYSGARSNDELGGPSTTALQGKIPLQIRRARHNYYFVKRDKSLGVHNAAYARFLLNLALAQVAAAP